MCHIAIFNMYCIVKQCMQYSLYIAYILTYINLMQPMIDTHNAHLTDDYMFMCYTHTHVNTDTHNYTVSGLVMQLYSFRTCDAISSMSTAGAVNYICIIKL